MMDVYTVDKAFMEGFKGIDVLEVYTEPGCDFPTARGILIPKLDGDTATAQPYDKLILNPPATIIIWNDGTKTVVKCAADELYNPEKGVALCFLKKEHPEIYRKILKDAGDAFEEWKEMVFKRVERDLLRDSKEAHHAPSSL